MKKMMLKLFSFALVIALSFATTSCNKEDVNNETPFVNLGSETIPVVKEGGTATLTVESNRAWSVEIPTDATWIAANPASGTNNGTITFTLLPNSGLERQADVKVKTATAYEYVRIIQAGAAVKTYVTVSELRAMGETTITSDVYLKASLINDQEGGNNTSLKNIYIQDQNAGMCVRLTANAETMAVGTELEFKLQGAVLSKYNGLLQLNNFANANMTKTGATVVMPAKSITAAQLLTGNYESMYVSVANVQVVNADLGKTMVVGTSHTSIGMEAGTGEKFVMFNASYSEFKALNVPQGSGTIKGIATINNTTIQLMPQVRADFSALTGARFGNAPELTYGTATLAGTMNKDVAFTNANKITLPFTEATTGAAYNISVAVSGAAAAGITTPATATGNFAAASGNITIELAGTPTVAGAVIFTITGTGITTPIVVNGTVTDPASSTSLATWVFAEKPAAFPIAASTAGGSTGASLTLTGFTTLPTLNHTASSKTIYVNTWAENKAWEFSLTPSASIASGKTLTVEFKGYSTSTGPRDVVVEYSKNGTTWVQMGDAIVYTSSIATFTRTAVLSESVSAAFKVRIRVSSPTATNGSPIADGGNSRLADVTISVN